MSEHCHCGERMSDATDETKHARCEAAHARGVAEGRQLSRWKQVVIRSGDGLHAFIDVPVGDKEVVMPLRDRSLTHNPFTARA